jgi:hypothetical protein
MEADLLLEENGSETRVEGTNTLILENLAEAANQAIGEIGLRHKTDTGGLEGAKCNVGEELGGSGRSEVDGRPVVGGSLVAELVDARLLEELVSSKLEGALEEVTGKGRSDTRPDSAEAFFGDDLTETTNEAAVVGDWVELYSCLDAVKRAMLVPSCLKVPETLLRCRRVEREDKFPGIGVSNLHIDWCEAAVGETTAYCTRKRETRVKICFIVNKMSSGMVNPQ